MHMNTQIQGTTPSPSEKVKKVLEAVGVIDIGRMKRAELVMAIGRLLSIKAKPGASVHEVTKEIRRSLELAVKFPVKEYSNEAVTRAVYTNPPFESEVLNTAYRILLEKLITETMSQISELGPMWRKRLINLTIENIYNIAVAQEIRVSRDRIYEALKEG